MVEPQYIVVFGEKSRKKSGKKWPFLTPVFWPFHRWEGEIQGIDGIINVYPFLHIDSFAIQNIGRRR